VPSKSEIESREKRALLKKAGLGGSQGKARSESRSVGKSQGSVESHRNLQATAVPKDISKLKNQIVIVDGKV
jgi:hypothetical protein